MFAAVSCRTQALASKLLGQRVLMSRSVIRPEVTNLWDYGAAPEFSVLEREPGAEQSCVGITLHRFQFGYRTTTKGTIKLAYDPGWRPQTLHRSHTARPAVGERAASGGRP